MNYRHHFHAGNFADVMKHSLLMGLLAALQKKDTPFCYLDTHAGVWRYEPGWPLDRAEAQVLALGEDTATLRVRPDTGMAAWISCAGE